MENDENAVDDMQTGDDDAAGGLAKPGSPEIVMSLAKYDDGDYITKAGLAEAFGCAERTIQRMVERLELPPSMLLAGRKVWIVGKLRTWIRAVAERKEDEAIKARGFLHALDE